MSGVPSKRGRTRVYDAERTRELMLNAAETVFAKHGYNGASVDAIAAAAGYNKSLIFQYFGDKLGLYTEVVKRADRDLTALLVQALTPLHDNTLLSDPQAFRVFLERLVRTVFDYLVDHPRFRRTLIWEQAEGWQTYTRIISKLATDDGDWLATLFTEAHRAGMLRSDFVPIIQVALIVQLCLSYLTFLPLYALLLGDERSLQAPAALEQARAYLVHFVVHGLMDDSHHHGEGR